MFKHIGTKGGSLRFDDISPQLAKVPSWMESRGSVNDTQVLSLKPPKIPVGLDEVGGEPEPFIRPEAADDASEPEESVEALDAAQAIPEEASPSQFDGLAEARRSDTFVEEIVPRAEEEAVAAIREAVKELVDGRQQLLKSSEEQIVQLVRVISERVIARELHTNPSVISGMVREGLGALTTGDTVTIRVGDFFAIIVSQLEHEIARMGVTATVLVDPGVGTYGCQIQTEWGSVDESVETRLRTLLEGISIAPPRS